MIKCILNWVLLAGCIAYTHAGLAGQPKHDYLLKPTGKYGVAFKDIHWIDGSNCPDPNFSQNQNDFSANNKQYCHEIMVRIYYPTPFKTYNGTAYYKPAILAEQNALRAKHLKYENIEKLSRLKSHTIENAPIIKNVQFPILLFISGLGGQVQLYENLITELVSHGYIVVGINSMFINGDIALPNDKIISTIDVQSWNVATTKIIPILERDVEFVYKKIHDKSQNALFNSMDLKHIGVIGHSFGGRAVANVVNRHETWFQALVTFDMEAHMGSFEPRNVSIMPPSMHIITAYWRTAFNWMNLHYRLNKNGYLVTLSPTSKDKHYSYHMNFTDFSMLQYMPVYQASMAQDNSRLKIREDVIIKTDGKKFGLQNVKKPTYLIVKNKHSWEVIYYELKKEPVAVSLEAIPGLQLALDHLSEISPKQSELISIKKMIHAWHQRFGNYLGRGNGFKITQALNLYLLDFFNTFLKNESNPLVDCLPLTTNTYLECGPGVFK